MFAVRYTWVSVNKALTSTRINSSDQLSYSVQATQTGTELATATSSGAGGSGFTPAVATVASGYPITIADAMAAGSTTPVQFIDGTPASGLGFASANVSYSNQPNGGPPYDYTPIANAVGVDLRVTGLRIAPTGTMAGASAAGQPSFRVSF